MVEFDSSTPVKSLVEALLGAVFTPNGPFLAHLLSVSDMDDGDFVLSLVAPELPLLLLLLLLLPAELGSTSIPIDDCCCSFDGVIERRLLERDACKARPPASSSEEVKDVVEAARMGLVVAPSFVVKSVQLRLNRLDVLSPEDAPLLALPF